MKKSLAVLRRELEEREKSAPRPQESRGRLLASADRELDILRRRTDLPEEARKMILRSIDQKIAQANGQTLPSAPIAYAAIIRP